MKRKSLIFLLTVLMSMVGANAFAAFDTSTRVSVGVWYYYLDKTNHCAQVTKLSNGGYSGNRVIPASITYNNISYSVTSIAASTFNSCTGLTSISIPNSVTDIGSSAFSNCTSLTSIEIPNGVTSIRSSTFDNSGLTSVVIPNSVTSIESFAFSRCSGLTSVVIPNSVTSISDGAFSNCRSLTSVVIPNSVTSIGETVFSNCSGLTSVVIPNSVTSIASNAFSNCTSLTSVTVDKETPLIIDENTFPNRTNATLYVPVGSMDAYWEASYWNEFKEIKEIEEAEPEEVPESVCIAMNAGEGKPRTMIGYSSPFALDFTNVTDVKAYIVVGYNDSKEALLVHVNVVPARTGIVIKTQNPGVVVDVPTTTEEYYYSNLLVPVVSLHTIYPTETIDGEEFTNFVVGTLNSGEMGFVRVTSSIQRRNKSYLRVPSRLYNAMSNAPALGGIGMEIIDDETTGINPVDNNGQLMKGNVYYDLNGRRVEHPTRGLYIVNGKKVVIK